MKSRTYIHNFLENKLGQTKDSVHKSGVEGDNGEDKVVTEAELLAFMFFDVTEATSKITNEILKKRRSEN